jgi:hypothetical protein
MRKITIFTLVMFTFNAFSISIKKATDADLKILVNAASMQNSASWATHIGDSVKKIYFEYETMAHLSSFSNNKQ